MGFTNRTRTGTVLAACVVLGAAGGIAGSMAAPSKKKATARTTKTFARHHDLRGGFDAPGGPHGGHAVHAEEVVLNKAGTAFITETEDNGVVKSVSGNDVTITEGTDKVTYKDVTVTIGSGATITRNGKTAAVGDLKAGDNIAVSSSSDGTNVFAFDSTFAPADGPGRHGGPGDHHWPPPAGAPGG